jgi:hypothetical protein
MTFWLMGDEEPADDRFRAAGIAASGLYHMAGAQCMREVRNQRDPLPAQWFIPDHWVRGWPSGPRTASRLVQVGLWERVDGGYRFAWIRDQNTPAAVGRSRARYREKKRNQRANVPLGTYRGDICGPANHPEKRAG